MEGATSSVAEGRLELRPQAITLENSEARLRNAYLRQICYIYYGKSKEVDGKKTLSDIEYVVNLYRYFSIIKQNSQEQKIDITALKGETAIDGHLAEEIKGIKDNELTYNSITELIKNSLYSSLKNFLDANWEKIIEKGKLPYGISRTTLESFLTIYFEVLGFNLSYISEGDSKTDFLQKLRALITYLGNSSSFKNKADGYLNQLSISSALVPLNKPDSALVLHSSEVEKIETAKETIIGFLRENKPDNNARMLSDIDSFSNPSILEIAELIKITSLEDLLSNPLFKANLGKTVENKTVAFILATKLIELGFPNSNLAVTQKNE